MTVVVPRQTFLPWLTSLLALCLITLPSMSPANQGRCFDRGPQIQVLGSGGSDLRNNRAASSYLIWINGKARVLIGAGPGSAMRFHKSGAHFSDLKVILFTSLRGEQTADFTSLILSTINDGRKSELPIYGPGGNKFMHSSVAFIRALFDQKRGAFRNLGTVLSPLGRKTYKLKPHDISTRIRKKRLGKKIPTTRQVFNDRVLGLKITAVSVQYNKIPSLAWRLESGGKSMVFSGKVSGDPGNLEELAQHADLLVVPTSSNKADITDKTKWDAATLGRIAYRAKVKQLVLDHRTSTNDHLETRTLAIIRTKYAGLARFADEGGCLEY